MNKRPPLQITVHLTFTDPVNGPRKAVEALIRDRLYPTDTAHVGVRQSLNAAD